MGAHTGLGVPRCPDHRLAGTEFCFCPFLAIPLVVTEPFLVLAFSSREWEYKYSLLFVVGMVIEIMEIASGKGPGMEPTPRQCRDRYF